MFGISVEHFLIVGVILLLVGPKKLPQLGNSMGKAFKNFKDSIAGVEEANFKRVNPPEAAQPETKIKTAETTSSANPPSPHA